MTALRIVLSDGQEYQASGIPGTVVESRDQMAKAILAGASINIGSGRDGGAIVINSRHVMYVEVTP